jgi:hypothetical protein
MLDVPAELLRYLSRLLAAERRRRGTPARSRKLTCRGQALLALRGVPYVILDGKVFETDRLAETVTSKKGEDIDAWYSGSKHRPGANVQAVMLPSDADSPCPPSAGPLSSASPPAPEEPPR